VVVLDLFSVPFEALEGARRDVPVVLVLPPEFDAEFLIDVFGAVAFEGLGFFDRVATADDALWGELRRRYGWAGGQRLGIGALGLEEAAGEVADLLEAEEAETRPDEKGPIRRRTRLGKTTHRAQDAALQPQFAAARGNRDDSVPFAVLEVGVGIGRWAASFDLTKTRFVGADAEGDTVEAARKEFPEVRFDAFGENLALPYEDEKFDMTFSVDVMHRNPTPVRRVLLSEMWRVTRPGGRLIFLDEFVSGRRPGVYPMPVRKFVGLLLEATGGQVVLEHVESLRYPQDDLVRGGVISVSRLGVPKTW
jgi:2-polyprenyl-3-methyl-5-hydroxy-6-metoxy-1,4-benzoquinol methylase